MTGAEVLFEERPLTVQVARLFPNQGEWTERDYFLLPATHRLIELSDGDLIMPPHPTDTHQQVVGNLYAILRRFASKHNLGWVRFAPLPVRLWPGKVREPDVLFLAREHADRRGEQVWGPPDLVMEVLSPGTELLDRETKHIEYARAGIAEYWIVDPEGRSVEVWALEQGNYTLAGGFGPGQTASSRLLQGFQVAVDDVFGE